MYVVIIGNYAGVKANPDIWYKDMMGCVFEVEESPYPDEEDRYRVLNLPKYWTGGACILKEDVMEVEMITTKAYKLNYD